LGVWDSSLGFLLQSTSKERSNAARPGGSILERYRYGRVREADGERLVGQPARGREQPAAELVWEPVSCSLAVNTFKSLASTITATGCITPELGRFLQIDPMGFDAGDMNLFRYCDDDPVDGTDPTGLLNMWGNLEKFYSGNPSTNVFRDAWNQQRSPGFNNGADSRHKKTLSTKQLHEIRSSAGHDGRLSVSHLRQNTDLHPMARQFAGYDYSVKEKTKVIVNKFTGAKELVIVTGDKLGYQALPRSGSLRIALGPRTQPSHNVSEN